MGPIKTVTGDVGDKLFTDGAKKAVLHEFLSLANSILKKST
jgi:hypothetical protein